jgi:hypothetical protein
MPNRKVRIELDLLARRKAKMIAYAAAYPEDPPMLGLKKCRYPAYYEEDNEQWNCLRDITDGDVW